MIQNTLFYLIIDSSDITDVLISKCTKNNEDIFTTFDQHSFFRKRYEHAADHMCIILSDTVHLKD